jgi:TolB-like protein/DNA-binding CsgD family transcriptional regulator
LGEHGVRQPAASGKTQVFPSDLELTKRQLKVLALLMQGKSNKMICRALDLAESTVKYHVTAILKALKVSNRTEAALAARALVGTFPAAPASLAERTEHAHSRLALQLPDKPSLAVLPFVNLSGDPDQDYFADGVVEDIIIALGRLNWLFVIGSGSAFFYRGRVVTTKQIGLELGVRYVLRGSVRKTGRRVRIVVELSDASTGGQIWGDHFDGELDDIFALQDQVAARVSVLIAPSLREAEIERVRRTPTENLTAYDLVLQALPLCRLHSTNNEKALPLLYRAIELDQSYGAAYGLAALCYRALLVVNRKIPTDPRVAEGIRLANLAAEHGLNNTEALWMAGETIFMLSGELERSQGLIEQSTLLNTNSASAWNALGIVRTYVGDSTKGLEHFARARRLDPVHSFHHNYWVGTSLAHFLVGHNEASESAADMVLSDRPGYPMALGLKAASCGLQGKRDEGRKCVERLLSVNADATVSAFRAIYGAPLRSNPTGLKAYLRGLQLSGLPVG